MVPATNAKLGIPEARVLSYTTPKSLITEATLSIVAPFLFFNSSRALRKPMPGSATVFGFRFRSQVLGV